MDADQTDFFLINHRFQLKEMEGESIRVIKARGFEVIVDSNGYINYSKLAVKALRKQFEGL